MDERDSFKLLQRLCLNNSRSSDFTAEFVSIEFALLHQGIRDAVLLDYVPPYEKDCHITMSVENGKLGLTVESKDKSISLTNHGDLEDLHKRGEALRELMDELHLTFAPAPDNNFINEIMATEKGSIINFNNQLAIICVDDKDGKRVFKRQFEGSLSNITLDSFRKSNTYIVDVDNPKDIHYLFGKAYTSLSNTADIRISKNSSMGQFICTDIETALKKDTSRTVKVGPLCLYVSKDSAGHSRWYDESLNTLDRDLVAVILGWARNSLAEICTRQWVSYDIMSGFDIFSGMDYSPFLAKIKKLSAENDSRSILQEAFNFADGCGGIATLTFDALVQDTDNNFISTTYAFLSQNGEKKICKFTYQDNNPLHFMDTCQEVSEEDFFAFCNEKFGQSYRSIISQSTELIRNLYQGEGMSKKEAILAAIKKYEDEHPENFLGITKEDINRISKNVAILVSELHKNKNAFSIKVHDFLEEDYDNDTR